MYCFSKKENVFVGQLLSYFSAKNLLLLSLHAISEVHWHVLSAHKKSVSSFIARHFIDTRYKIWLVIFVLRFCQKK